MDTRDVAYFGLITVEAAVIAVMALMGFRAFELFRLLWQLTH